MGVKEALAKTNSDVEVSERYLMETYGYILSLRDVAHILQRSPEGLRDALRRDNEIAKTLNRGKKRIGRRVYFRASAVAELIA